MTTAEEFKQLSDRVRVLETLIAQQVKVNQGLLEQIERRDRVGDLHYGACMNSAHYARALASAALAQGRGASALEAFEAVREDFKSVFSEQYLPAAWSLAPDWLDKAMGKG